MEKLTITLERMLSNTLGKDSIYKNYNPNPHPAVGVKSQQKQGDCAIRTILALLNDKTKTWEGVYTDLFNIAKSRGCMPNNKFVILEYLKQYGYKGFDGLNNYHIPVAAFIHRFHREVYAISISGHIFTVRYGVIWDIWDDKEWNNQVNVDNVLKTDVKYVVCKDDLFDEIYFEVCKMRGREPKQGKDFYIARPKK